MNSGYGALLCAFALAVTLGLSGCSRQITREEWIAEVPNAQTVAMTGQIQCRKSDLFAAVRNPDNTQSVGDMVYVYWECSDGEIQVQCSALAYKAHGMVIGTVNEF